MKLKSIRIHGFKSFADKTNLEFKSHITAIVGPNGSGKSNIVDAIRWVLGEQSVKSLRGSKEMSDVIFAGSETRAPFKRAEVALTFDNTEHYLNSDLIDVEVKRILYATGENEYYINNVKVRLKDIRDLFLDSGIGEDSFHIISQGNIESIITSKPQDRRILLESSAQVLKYKNRKTESLKKLDKTKDNLEKVDLVLHELEERVNPLKEQSEKASKYLGFKEELESLEIALTTQDISDLNEHYKEISLKVSDLTKKKEELEASSSLDNSSLEKMKLDLIKLEDEIAMYQDQLISYNDVIAKLNSEKTLTLERQKYEVDSKKIDENLLHLKESELDSLKQQETLIQEKKEIESLISKYQKEKRELDEEYSLINVSGTHLQKDLEQLEKEVLQKKNRIEILQSNIDNHEGVSYAVKNVLNNPRLSGIHNVIGRLIEVDEACQTAVEVALGASANFLVVDDENSAKKAISYLKENQLGRATFFPISVIQSRYVSDHILKDAKSIPGVLGMASDFVSCDEAYVNIIKNQLGNVFVVENMDVMQLLGKKLDHKYRIVTLDGELSNIGGSLTGGSLKNNHSTLKEKQELQTLKQQVKLDDEKQKILTEQEMQISQKKDRLLQKISELDHKIVIEQQVLVQKNRIYLEQETQLEEVQKQIAGANSLKDGSIEEDILKLVEKIKEQELLKESVTRKLDHLKQEKSEISSEIADLENQYRLQNSKFHTIEQDLKKYEVELGKYDTKMDYLLNILSEEYHITYEKARLSYHLEMEGELARMKVSSLKKEMNALGDVNISSIEEYAKVKERYDFLLGQQQDLNKSCEDLLSVIDEMDEIMKERLQNSFEAIQKEFSIVYKKLFKGGYGMLKLTDPDNILETGIEIEAQPPGKKLNNIALLSGGEKTLTAIALLFSILNVYPVPFCVLDEVEAALDEANVDTFGKYLQEQETKSEFILITHKKKTMEYAGTLYGITMQEQGVSKVVSVQLEGAHEA